MLGQRHVEPGAIDKLERSLWSRLADMIAGMTAHEMFASLRRWTGQEVPSEEIPLAASTGSHSVLFGTNYPMISHEHALADLDDLGLDAETRQRYLHENAARVFGLTAPSPSATSAGSA